MIVVSVWFSCWKSSFLCCRQIKVLDGEDQYYKSLSPGACVPEESDSAHSFCFPSSPRGDSVAQHWAVLSGPKCVPGRSKGYHWSSNKKAVSWGQLLWTWPVLEPYWTTHGSLKILLLPSPSSPALQPLVSSSCENTPASSMQSFRLPIARKAWTVPLQASCEIW